ncbi:DUF1796 family putative cysteine peptidase [Paenibacillus tarimensis]|uniref:DUF1796 family putative cysteine peptidase n=1 Tax=Paenibacillus tarimensis TaxID=416012 RepID=UPI001F3BE2C9|nr:DUF1796 family putative cysteine peptidase [Paenibacillus tarimensis]MCF2942246.1 papain-like cysteine peptidase [Paenibacillus tarimensis]
MQLKPLKGTYDAVFSLGHLCIAGIQLEKNGLRPFAGPLDWMSSPSLSDVNRLLANRFARFMDYPHLVLAGQASDKLYLVKETEYNVYSNHDFFTHNNFPPHFAAYPEIKAKYDRRVSRFLAKCSSSRRMLFIRTEGTYEEAGELEKVLANLVRGDFRVLLVNHAPVEGITPLNWPLRHVTAVQLPNSSDILTGNSRYWTELLSGILVTSG